MNKNITQDSDINRLIKACAYEETDRVPSFEHYVMRDMMNHILGKEKMEEIICSEDMLRVLYLYTGTGSPDNFTVMGGKITPDVVSMLWNNNLIPWFSFMLPPVHNLELLKATGVDAATPMLTWVPNVRNINQNGAFDQDGIVQEWDDIDKIKIPPRQIEKMMELTDWYLETYKDTKVGVGPMCRSCFCNTYEVLGIQNFMLKLYDDMGLIEHIMDIFTDYAKSITRGLSQRNIDCFWLDDDVCMNSGLMVKPEFIEKLWMPRTDEMLAPLREKKIPIYMHCCGNVKNLIPYALELGITALHPLQPNCNDIFALKKAHTGTMAFFGNLDLAGVLTNGSPAEVEKETRQLIEILAPGGGYVVGSSHSITDSVPPDNYYAMIETTQRYKK